MEFLEIKNLAEKLLRNKTRLSGEPYFDYVLKISNKLRKYGVRDETTLTLPFFHHCLDQTPLREQEKILNQVSDETKELLKKYHKFVETKIKTEALKDFNEKYLVQTCINLVEDVRVLTVRIVEKLEDLENSWMFPKEKREDIAFRAMYLYAPLAKILGINALSRDLEDTAFKILFPMEYFTLKKAIDKRKRGTNKSLGEIKKFLKDILAEEGFKDFQISYRVKGIYSTYKKLIRKESDLNSLEGTLDKIYDLVALRIVVKTTEECYLVENILQQLWENIPSERNDYIKTPRNTGYQAIHNAFKITKKLAIEVQIKTHEMHRRAEFGMCSHLLYKIGDKGQKSFALEEYKKYLTKHPEWFKDLNFWELQSKKGYIPSTPFSDKEYVLTPKGDIIELPKGSSVVDFAFAVHSDIGEKCVGAFVNNKIVRLDCVVKTGDIVKIKTDRRKKGPSKDWLRFVRTRKARVAINQRLEKKPIKG
jgi:guanosine-3',5'-bis(diphosphate) 3'-pyrophosphohydrolase